MALKPTLGMIAVISFTSFAQTSATTTETLSAQISPIGKVSVPAAVSLLTAGTTFSTYTGTLLVSQRVRTTSSGSAAITVTASAEFTLAGGPTIAAGGLTYTCGSATLGAACSGSKTVSTTMQTAVLSVGGSACTGGGGACSSSDPNTVTLSFTLTNNPAFKTGTFSAGLTFLISAT